MTAPMNNTPDDRALALEGFNFVVTYLKQIGAENLITDKLEPIRKALETPAPVWMDIESAPKDGTEFLAIQDIPSTVYMVVSYDNSSVDEDMVWASTDGIYHKDLFTHWMPLPTPPELKD